MSPQARLDALIAAPPNSWIAFSANEEQVVAIASSYDEVVAAAAQKGVSDPIVMKTPDNWDARILAD